MIVILYWLLLMWEYSYDTIVRIVYIFCHTIYELNINIKIVVTLVDNIWDYHTKKLIQCKINKGIRKGHIQLSYSHIKQCDKCHLTYILEIHFFPLWI